VYRFKTHLGALPQLQALKVPVADKRPGKHETDQDAMPVHNRGEGSELLVLSWSKGKAPSLGA